MSKKIKGYIVLNKFFHKIECIDVFDTKKEAQEYADEENKAFREKICIVGKVIV